MVYSLRSLLFYHFKKLIFGEVSAATIRLTWLIYISCKFVMRIGFLSGDSGVWSVLVCIYFLVCWRFFVHSVSFVFSFAFHLTDCLCATARCFSKLPNTQPTTILIFCIRKLLLNMPFGCILIFDYSWPWTWDHLLQKRKFRVQMRYVTLCTTIYMRELLKSLSTHFFPKLLVSKPV